MRTRSEKINRVKLNLRRGAYYRRGSRVSDFTIEKTGIASMIDRISLAEKKVRAITRNGYTFYEADKEVRDLVGTHSGEPNYNPLFDLSNDGEITEDDIDGLYRYDKYFPTYIVNFSLNVPSSNYQFEVINLKYVNVDGKNLEIESSPEKLYVTIPNTGNHTMSTGLKMINDNAFASENTIITAEIVDGNDYIGKSAFENCTKLTSASVPGSVKIIGDNAFKGCVVLTSCTIESGVKGIGSSAFQNCSKLASMEIPGSVASISGSSFSNCTSLTSLTIGTGAGSMYVGSDIFNGTTKVEYITCYGAIPFAKLPTGTSFKGVILGNAVTGILSYNGSTGLSSCTIGTGISAIGDNCFNGCSKLETFNTVNAKTIGANAFNGCTGLSSLTINSSVTSVTSTSFSNCNNIKRLICNGKVNFSDLPTGTSFQVVSLGSTVSGSVSYGGCTGLSSCTITTGGITGITSFSGCTKLSALTIPTSVKAINSGAFQGSALSSITVPAAVAVINSDVFKNCTGLTSCTLGTGVTSIGDAFNGCSKLKTLTVRATTPPLLAANAFSSVSSNFTIKVPSASVNAYKAADGWSTYANIISAI